MAVYWLLDCPRQKFPEFFTTAEFANQYLLVCQRDCADALYVTVVMVHFGYYRKQEAQLMLTTGSTRLAVSRGQQTWYHSTCYI